MLLICLFLLLKPVTWTGLRERDGKLCSSSYSADIPSPRNRPFVPHDLAFLMAVKSTDAKVGGRHSHCILPCLCFSVLCLALWVPQRQIKSVVNCVTGREREKGDHDRGSGMEPFANWFLKWCFLRMGYLGN